MHAIHFRPTVHLPREVVQSGRIAIVPALRAVLAGPGDMNGRNPTPCIACWFREQMPSRTVPKVPRKSASSPPSPTRSRPMRRCAGQRARCLAERGRLVCVVQHTDPAICAGTFNITVGFPLPVADGFHDAPTLLLG